MKFQGKETALLLVETLNEFMHPGGAFHEKILEVARQNGCIANLVELPRRLRGRLTIAYAPIGFSSAHPELKGRCGVLAGVVEANALVRDSFGAHFFSELAPEPTDLVLDDRRGISAFHGSNLDALLRGRGIRRIAIGGFLTNVCVESTVRSAYDHGYEIVFLRDATACFSMEEQTFCETRIMPYFARVMTTDEFIDDVTGST
jgi:nicotinamidase-related amidase